MLTGEPFKATEARKRVRQIVVAGSVTVLDHAVDELAKDGYSQSDALNCLRSGIVDEPEYENGAWRYRVRTNKLCVVVEFLSETHLFVVTGWKP